VPLWKEILKETIEKSFIETIHKLGDNGSYKFVHFPEEGWMESDYMHAKIDGSLEMLGDWLHDADAIILIEAKGFLDTPLPFVTNKPVGVIRKKDYPEIQDKVVVDQTTAYKSTITRMCGSRIKRGLKYIVFDDVISSGGTAIAVVRALEAYGCKVIGIASTYERGDGADNIRKETGHAVRALVRVGVRDGKAYVERFYDETIVRNVILE